MNIWGNLATEIYNYEFDGDSSSNTMTSISGWLETHIGQLNTLLYTQFDLIGTGLDIQASVIFKEIYLQNYYSKQARNALRGIIAAGNDGSNILEVKDADSSISFINKNEVAKVYKSMANDSKAKIDQLVAQYNIYSAQPRQVAGVEGTLWTGVLIDNTYPPATYVF